MNKETFTDIETSMAALEVDQVVEPKLPIAIYLQEANDLVVNIKTPEVRETLIKVDLNPQKLDALDPAVDLLRDLQSQWTVVRDRGKPEAQVERETEGYERRSETIRAGRWHLRDDKQALAVLDDIAEGEGVPDLIQDLFNLATLVETHHPKFQNDKTWDWKQNVERLKTLASEISAGKSEAIVDLTQETAKDKRDRAFTYVEGLIKEIRQAGRWAFRNDKTRLPWFGSAYIRKQVTKTRAPQT